MSFSVSPVMDIPAPDSPFDLELDALFEASTCAIEQQAPFADDVRGISREQFKTIIKDKMNEAYHYGKASQHPFELETMQ